MEENKKETKPEKIVFETDEGSSEWFVLDQTRINGCNYILVADEFTGDAECMILKDIAPAESKDSIYEEIEDDNELDIVAGMFEESMGEKIIL